MVEVRDSTCAVANVQAQGLPRCPDDASTAQIPHVVDLHTLARFGGLCEGGSEDGVIGWTHFSVVGRAHRQGCGTSSKSSQPSDGTFWVELVHVYSNLTTASGRLARLRCDAMSHPRSHPGPPPPSHRGSNGRLGAELIERVVSEYAAGVSSTQLAKTTASEGTLLRL